MRGSILARSLVLGAVLALSACEPAPQPTVYPSIDAANAVPPGDPRAEGQYRFLYDSWGAEQLDEWPPAEFMLSLMRAEPEVFGDQYAKFGFIRDPDDEFPIGFKRGLVDRDRVDQTCALCHVARLPDGRLWLGAPNTTLDMGRFRVEVDRRWVAAGNPSQLSALAAEKALQLGPGRFNAESSSYPMPVAADFPPYFRLGQKTAMNYLGTGRNLRTEVHFSIYTFGPGSPNPKDARVPFPVEERIQAFLDFFGTIDAPAGPPQDAARVAAGRAVFERARCDSCHHVEQPELDGIVSVDKRPGVAELFPGQDPAYARGTVRTDPLHLVLLSGDGGSGGMDQGYFDLLRFIEQYHLSVRFSDGYRAAPLEGLWATAPYLHNGSVPTLEDLLRPEAERPALWMRGAFPIDTTLPGNSNGGHQFGVDLPDDDKAALLAYLRSL